MVDLDSDYLIDCLLNSFMILLEPLKPYIASFIVGAVLLRVLKKIFHEIHDFINFHQSSREQKAAHKRIDNAVDFISNLSDLISMSNSDKRQR